MKNLKKWPPLNLKHPAPTPPRLLPPPTALKGRQHLPTPSPPLQQPPCCLRARKMAKLLKSKKQKQKKNCYVASMVPSRKLPRTLMTECPQKQLTK